MIKIDLATTDLTAFTAVELRKIGGVYGIKGAAKAKKAEIIAAMAPLQEDAREKREAKKAEAARKIEAPKIEAPKIEKPAKPAKVRKIRFTQDELAGEENSHSDNSHDEINAGKFDFEQTSFALRGDTPAQRKAFDEWIVSEREIMARCPICHPEIVANSAHSGSSRLGMVINVPVRADGRAKAETVAKRLDAIKVPAKVRRFKGNEILTATVGDSELKLVWDAQGRYQYGESTYKGRKVRNVSEALRLVLA